MFLYDHEKAVSVHYFNDVEPGDVIFWQYHGWTYIDHTQIVDSVTYHENSQGQLEARVFVTQHSNGDGGGAYAHRSLAKVINDYTYGPKSSGTIGGKPKIYAAEETIEW